MKWALTVILITFVVTTAMAQSEKFESETYIGINGGYTASQVNFLPSIRQDYFIGNHGGFIFRHNSQAHLGVQAELNFVQRGWQEQSAYKRQLDYLELPFLTHIYVGKQLQFFFNIGPKLSIMLNNNVIATGTESAAAKQYAELNKPIDYGFCGGIGVQLKTRTQVFIIDTRFNYSISNIFPDQLTDHFSTSNNINASLSAAWLIRTK
jgi:hypothetical protein